MNEEKSIIIMTLHKPIAFLGISQLGKDKDYKKAKEEVLLT